MSIQTIWDEYKRQRDGDHFTANASVVFVPTSAGARGYDAVRQFLASTYDPRKATIKERVIHRVISTDSVVEETDTTITFLTGESSWIVPGVDSRHTSDVSIVIPIVTVAIFEQDRISSIRVYWDQASVLKQLKLIGDKNNWPIVSERQIDAVRDVSLAHLNPFARTETAAGVSRSSFGEPTRRNVHTSSRVNQPGGTGGMSTIFSEVDDEEERRSVRSSRGNRPGGMSTIFSDVNEEQPIRRNVNTSGRSGGVSSVFSGGNEGQETARRNVHTSSRVNQPGGTGGVSNIFGDPNEEQESARRNVHTSSRVNQPGGTGGVSNIFGDSSEEQESARRNVHTSGQPGGTSGASTVSSDLNEEQEIPRRDVHTSSRVNQPSGTGGASNILSDPNEEQETVRRNVHTSSRVNKPGGTGGTSSIILGDSSEESTARKNKSTAQFVVGGDNRSQQSQRKNYPGTGRSQINFTEDDDTGPVFDSISGSKRRAGKSQFESSMSFGDDSTSDQQQQSSSGQSGRPSSRVLKPPGGGSNITFG